MSGLRSELIESGVQLPSTAEPQASSRESEVPIEEIAAISELSQHSNDALEAASALNQPSSENVAVAGEAEPAMNNAKQVSAIAERVLERVREDESIRLVKQQYQELKGNLQDLLLRLDSGATHDQTTSSTSIDLREFDSLRDVVNESVKLNRSLGLELRHQRQQRNQDVAGMSSRLEAIERSLSGNRPDDSAPDGSAGVVLSTVEQDDPTTTLDDPAAMFNLEQAALRLQELANKNPNGVGPSMYFADSQENPS
jgi:hypothetical protein